MTEMSFFHYEDLPGEPGWKRWELQDPTRFNALLGPLAVKLEDGYARVRMTPQRQHSNLRDSIHGGATLAFIDIALFAAARCFGVLEVAGAVTLDLSTQFIGGARIGEPIEAHIELLRETGRLLFMRGLVKQEEAIVASFTGTIRKPR